MLIFIFLSLLKLGYYGMIVTYNRAAAAESHQPS